MLPPGLRRRSAPPALKIALAFGFTLLAAGTARAAPPADCAAPRALLERFTPADCEACWRDASAPDGAPLVLDWIVPDSRGEDAALAAAAIAEAAPRAGALPAARTLARRHALQPAGELAVTVEQGPAWSGYIAAQVHVRPGAGKPAARRARIAGATAYLALVEQVRAGEEGTPVERMLVRSLVGPLRLDSGATVVTHLHAFRIPQGSKPARLTAIGWVERPRGAVIAAARVDADDCTPAR